MENNALLSEDQALGVELLRLTALLYFKEALMAQEYETCRELIDTAKGLGVNPGEISTVIADYLKTDGPGRQKGNRLRL